MRNETLREARATLRGFFASQPTEYLVKVFDACRSGAFAYSDSCNCIRGLSEEGYFGCVDRNLAYYHAETALNKLGEFFKRPDRASVGVTCSPLRHQYDTLARNRTLPIVLAEIRRRSKVAQPASPVSVEVGA